MFYEILLPLKLNWMPTYSHEEPLLRGTRVKVTFAHREYVGVVMDSSPSAGMDREKILQISEVSTGLPSISCSELELWRFLSEYYLCTMGEVYKAAYPQQKIKSELVLSRKNPTPLPAEPLGNGSRNSSKPAVIGGPDRFSVYARELHHTIDNGRSALILMPTMTGSNALKKFLKAEFKDDLLIHNSSQTPVQRRRTAEILRSGKAVAVAGTRSSIFLPFPDLGLVIVDEEQDSSYKQSEPNPRYNGRDAAIMLARIHSADVILGTDSPSLETLHNLDCGKFVRHPESSATAGGRIDMIDLQSESAKRGVKGAFSFKLLNRIKASPGPVCLIRGWEKEDDLASQADALFPGIRTDILTVQEALDSGTGYALTALLQADYLFDKEDFRSDEKALHILSRLACNHRQLVIQTSRAAHPVYSLLAERSDASSLLAERETFGLPPFCRLTDVVLRDDNPGRFAKFASILESRMPDAMPMRTPGVLRLRFRLPLSPSAATAKKRIALAVNSIESEYRYSGHIHIDVDPQ